MRPLRKFLDRIAPHFEKGGRLERLYPVYEVIDSFFYTTDEVTTGSVHVRDALEFKRMMSVVLVALVPCTIMAMYNTGLQSNTWIENLGASVTEVLGWRGEVMNGLGLSCDPGNLLSNFVLGAMYFLPIYIVTFVVGVLWELLFCVVRKHELNEGLFVTALLFPLTLPANIPLWQVALGISFGVVVAKEIFGGTGRNFLNPALAARAFLFFAYAKQISGDLTVWTAGHWNGVDGFSGATPLGAAGANGLSGVTDQGIEFSDALLGTISGSMGETSTLACLIGAAILLLAGVGSWRIMSSMFVGAMALATVCWAAGFGADSMYQLPPHWHFVLGGFAFGLVFMATDPVTASMTHVGQFIYGALIGMVVIVVRVMNTAFPEGTMLAILLGNTFAPLIDYYVVRANIRRRALRHG
ncbi:MAG: NADH:ubiquinone reductase (Na(+)-transporting) subunit B [Planctomycetes bacterium RBG_13_63_9]|nr:MAG: NADH:ubiquinone reductase (Na(+)-transporting) subunit B [Planctomycetes bacterium RBG_13_63_9]